MNPFPFPSSLVATVAAQLRPFDYVSLLWENELLSFGEIAAADRGASRAFAARGVVISPWHGRLPEARAALDDGRVTPLDGALELSLGPGVTKTLRVLRAEPAGRQPILFLALDGFFAGEKSPYDTTELAADTLAFAMAVDALLGAAGADGRLNVWAADWPTAPAVLLLGARHVTALHLHDCHDRWLGEELRHFYFPRAAALAHATALRAALGEAHIAAGANRGFVTALNSEDWPVYRHALIPHLREVVARIEPVETGPLVELRPEWVALMHEMELDAHRAGTVLAHWIAQTRKRLPLALRRTIRSRAIILVADRSVTQHVPEAAVAAARRLLAAGEFSGYFVFAPQGGDGFAARRRELLERLREEFPAAVSVVEDDPALLAAVRDAADFQVFAGAWQPHGAVLRGATIPVALGEGPLVQIAGYRPRGRAAELQARWHRADEPPCGWWLYAQAGLPPEVAAENWRDLVTAPPAAENGVFQAITRELVAGLAEAVALWRDDPVAIAAVALAALRRQAAHRWDGADGYGRMFELFAAARRRAGRAA